MEKQCEIKRSITSCRCYCRFHMKQNFIFLTVHRVTINKYFFRQKKTQNNKVQKNPFQHIASQIQ